ncbi:MAG: hypothetical protein A2W99_05270 [Bacteroidetes bacterium GWF2_33_16]|nr:MAG: hypothetical protein A2X00_17790 [Bacteroidetes bacterium GWE2_32_14]OFY06072.1 MAG: hypothetical protein A2W99_05270 [Bacteroidetes bacterium GWF2_33_16]
MKRKLILVSLLLITTLLNSNAQCNFENLLDSLKKQIATDEILLENFNVYLYRSDTLGALPVAKFPINYEKETTYRIRIISDQVNYSPGGIVQLVEGNVLKGTNYSVRNKKCFDSFDFINPFKREGELIIYFEDGKEGCAVVTLSKIKKE